MPVARVHPWKPPTNDSVRNSNSPMAERATGAARRTKARLSDSHVAGGVPRHAAHPRTIPESISGVAHQDRDDDSRTLIGTAERGSSPCLDTKGCQIRASITTGRQHNRFVRKQSERSESAQETDRPHACWFTTASGPCVPNRCGHPGARATLPAVPITIPRHQCDLTGVVVRYGQTGVTVPGQGAVQANVDGTSGASDLSATVDPTTGDVTFR